MRPSYFLVCALLSHAVIGCSDSLPNPPPPPPPEPVTVHLNSVQAPLFVAFRDGFTDAAWKSVTPGTAVTFSVTGAYSVTVVCSQPGGGFLMWQASHNTDDDTSKAMPEPTLSTPCGPPADLHTVSGHAAQAGFVSLAGVTKTIAAAGDQFLFSVPDGTYYLTANDTAQTKIAFQAVTVDGADVTLATAVDVNATAATSAAIKLEVDNPPNPFPPVSSKETVSATVEVTPSDGSASSQVFMGNLDFGTDPKKINKVMNALAVADAALAKGDTQTATMIGTATRAGATTDPMPRVTAIKTVRSLSRLFAMKDVIVMGLDGQGFSLPTRISAPAPAFDKSRLSVALPTLPALDTLSMSATGLSSTGATIEYDLDITASYFSSTLLARPVFDTDIPSFSATWKLDFSKEYNINITSNHDVFNNDGDFIGHDASHFDEKVTTMLVPPPT